MNLVVNRKLVSAIFAHATFLSNLLAEKPTTKDFSVVDGKLG